VTRPFFYADHDYAIGFERYSTPRVVLTATDWRHGKSPSTS